jgi:hypothetical protein
MIIKLNCITVEFMFKSITGILFLRMANDDSFVKKCGKNVYKVFNGKDGFKIVLKSKY